MPQGLVAGCAHRPVAPAAVVALVRDAVARLRDADHLDLPLVVPIVYAHAVQAGTEPLVEPARRNAVHRVDVARCEADVCIRLVLHVGGHADLFLGAGVEGHQVIVGERPVLANAKAPAHREVLGQHARAGAEPVQRGAACAPRVGALKWLGPGLHEPADRGRRGAGDGAHIGFQRLGGVGAGREGRIGNLGERAVERAQVVLELAEALHVARTGLDQQDAAAPCRQHAREHRRADACADDHHVVAVCG
ncbi:hypothetical protein D3C81_1304610 [compost metagenome]